jgi:MYXO-CTERM domain-containing protein
MKQFSLKCLSATLLLLGMAGANAADNLVTNGDFSSGLGTGGYGWYTGDGSALGSGVAFSANVATMTGGREIRQAVTFGDPGMYFLSFSAAGSGYFGFYDAPVSSCSLNPEICNLKWNISLGGDYRFRLYVPNNGSYFSSHLYFGNSGTTASTFRVSNVSLTSAGALPIPSPVPEPQTYAMLLAGLAALGAHGRRRSQGAKVLR